jgi:uncharacterized protein (TIGR02145 family)
MKKILLLPILIIMSTCDEPDPVYTKGDIAGKISQEGTNIPLSGVTVSITGVEQTMKTGEDGEYIFSELEADNYSVAVSKLGYIGDTKVLEVVPEKTTIGDFSLMMDLPTANPTTLIFNNDALTKNLELSNPRSGDMQYVLETSKEWLKVSPQSGIIPSQNKKVIQVTVETEGLAYGNYDELVIINVGDASLSIPVQVQYLEPPFIKITQPATDQEYKMGEVMPVTWESNLEGRVKIELLQYSSVLYIISESVENENGGTFNWEIPALNEESYQISITSVEMSSLKAISGAFQLLEGPTKPFVETGNPIELISTKLVISGTILDIGKQATQVDQHGHVYSQGNPLPTISDNKTTLGPKTVPGEFSSELTELEPGNTYYFRAYATNTKGTGYGKVISIVIPGDLPIIETSDVVLITQNSAQSGGLITSDGGNTILERGLVYGKNSPVTVDADKIIDDETGIGSFISTLSGLENSTIYFVRAYAENSAGISYGNETQFRTLGVKPAVVTIEYNSVTPNTVNLLGEVSNNGGESLTSFGFCWNTSANPTISNNLIEVGIDTLGQYGATLTGLVPNTTYHFRAFATNKIGTSYGSDISFTTLDGNPKVSTIAVEAIDATSINAFGQVSDDGGSELTSYGFCWGRSINPTTNDNKIELGTSISGDFNTVINNLSPQTTYYVRAYASNSVGVSYGDNKTVTTPEGLYLSFTAPYSGEEIPVGIEYIIEWVTNIEDTRIIIEYWNDIGMIELTNNANSTDNQFAWTPADSTPVGQNNYFKIYDYNSLEFIGQSPNFTIPGELVITNPTENYIAQIDSFEIEWIVNYETPLTIELYKGSQFQVEVVNGLNSKDQYYFWDAATNGITIGTGYRIKIIDENESDFFKVSPIFEFVENNSIFVDPRDGQTYKIVTIGNQTWFAEDLRYKTSGSTTGTYGEKYSIAEFNVATPQGWKVPSDNDWQELERYMGMAESEINITGWRYSNSVGEKLKSNSGWDGTNSVELNLLPNSGATTGIWWTNTQAYYPSERYYRKLNSDNIGVYRSYYSNVLYGIRCIRE